MYYGYDDGRHDYPGSDQERYDEMRAEWISEIAHELMNNREWLYEFDISNLDEKNWSNLIDLPVLLIHHLSCLCPDWRKAIKESKGVDRLIEIADTLYELIEEQAKRDAEMQLNKELGCESD